MTRYREVHDFWHVLCELPPSVYGEVMLKWLEAVQTGLPMCFLSGAVGPLRLSLKEREELVATGIPWAIRTGGDCEDLLCVYYEEHLARPLKDVQGELGIVPYRGGEK